MKHKTRQEYKDLINAKQKPYRVVTLETEPTPTPTTEPTPEPTPTPTPTTEPTPEPEQTKDKDELLAMLEDESLSDEDKQAVKELLAELEGEE